MRRITTVLMLAVALVAPGCGCGGDDGLVGDLRSAQIRVGGIVFVPAQAQPKPGDASTQLGEVDPAGSPISDVVVELWKDGMVVASITTNGAGEFTFDDSNVPGGLLPSTAYEVRVPRGCSSGQLDLFEPIPPDMGPDDMDSDGDGTIDDCYVVAPITTPAEGDDFTIDFGFLPVPQ